MSGSRAPWGARGTTALAALTGAAMVAASGSASWRANDRAGADFAERYAEMVFDLLPRNAVLIVHGDASGPLGYYRYVEQRRPDVTLYNLHGLVFGDRLYDAFLSTDEKERRLDRFVGATERAVFLDVEADIYPGDRLSRFYGFLREVFDDEAPDTVQLARHPRGEELFLDLLDRQLSDRWERVRRNGLLSRYGYYLGLMYYSGSQTYLEPMQALFERAQGCYTCLVGMAAALLDNAAAAHVARISAWLARADTLQDQALTKGESALLPFQQGRLAELTGDAATAADHYRRSFAVFPHPGNEATAALRRLGLVP